MSASENRGAIFAEGIDRPLGESPGNLQGETQNRAINRFAVDGAVFFHPKVFERCSKGPLIKFI